MVAMLLELTALLLAPEGVIPLENHSSMAA